MSSEPSEPNLDALNPISSGVVLPSSGRLAGIDYGTVRVGVAISDPTQTIASPLEVYTRRNEKLDAKYFIELVAAERIVGFVVGLPVHMSGDASEKSREAVVFGKWLHEITELPVTWFDERYTTAMARDVLSHSNLSGKKRKAQLDKLAAQILLSAYLESRSSGG
jgi:putative Holliday junction resolvase